MTVYLFYAGVNAAGLSEIGLSTSAVAEGGFSKEASNPKITRALLFVETDPETHDRLTHPAPLRFANDPLLATHCFCAARVTGTNTWRIYHFQETSDNPDTGIWTFVPGTSSLHTAGPSGTEEAWDRDGVAYPVIYYDVATDTFYAFVAGLNATDLAGTIGWQIGLYTFPSSDIRTWTKHPSSPLLAIQAPIPVIYTSQVGPALVVPSTTGFSAEAIVIVRQDDSTTHGISRVRDVVSATVLELYHEMPNLNVGDPSRAVAQVGPGMSMHPTHVEKLEDGTFLMRATAFEPFRKIAGTGNGLFEVQCVLTSPALTGPWVMDHERSLLSVPPNIWTADRVQSDFSFPGVEAGTPINIPLAFQGTSSVTMVVVSVPPAGPTDDIEVPMSFAGSSSVEFNLWKSGDNCVDKIDLFNTTLITLGLKPLASLSENTSNRRVLDAGWRHFRRKFLRDHYWNGATKTVELAAATDVTLPEKWEAAYDLPLDYLRAVIVNGYARGSTGEPWAIEVAQNVSKKVLFLHSSPARLEYVFDPGEALCLLDDQCTFALAVVYAAHVARALGKDADDIQQTVEKALRDLEDAKGSDGQEGTPRRNAPSPLGRSRRAGTARYTSNPNRLGFGWHW